MSIKSHASANSPTVVELIGELSGISKRMFQNNPLGAIHKPRSHFFQNFDPLPPHVTTFTK